MTRRQSKPAYLEVEKTLNLSTTEPWGPSIGTLVVVHPYWKRGTSAILRMAREDDDRRAREGARILGHASLSPYKGTSRIGG